MERRRLDWRCRRGLRELDLLLTRFLEDEWERADAAEQEAFQDLLECSDTVLWRYLLGQELPTRPELAALVLKLRAAPSSRA